MIEPSIALARVCDRGASYGTTHLAVSDALVDGRLSRQRGDALCKPRRSFKHGLGPASPHRRADCPRCLALAARLGLDVPEP